MIHSRTKVGCAHLLDVLSTKEYWTFNEIQNEEELIPYSVDLAVLIEYLIEKGLIDVVSLETKGHGIFHRCYQVSEKLS